MANTKKEIEQEFKAAGTTAQSQADVDAMSAKDRLWDSMNYTYGQQREASDRSYDQAYTQADNNLLNRGMQRSSYGQAVLAGIGQQKIDAQNKIYGAQIADYENRLQDIENQDWQKDFQERQFAEGVRQYDTSLGYQKERDAVGDSQWQQQFDFTKGSTDQQIAMGYAQSILANGQMPSDDILARAGLSREDAAKMMAQLSGGGGGRGGRKSGSGSGTTMWDDLRQIAASSNSKGAQGSGGIFGNTAQGGTSSLSNPDQVFLKQYDDIENKNAKVLFNK